MPSKERMTDKALFSYAEAVAYMGLSERWLRKAVKADLLTPAKFGTRRLFRRTALDGLIERAERDGVTLDSLPGVKPAAEADPFVGPPPRRPSTKAAA